MADEPSKITQEWFAKKPVKLEGQLELEPQQDEKPEAKRVTKLSAADVVARRLKEK